MAVIKAWDFEVMTTTGYMTQNRTDTECVRRDQAWLWLGFGGFGIRLKAEQNESNKGSSRDPSLVHTMIFTHNKVRPENRTLLCGA